MNNRYLVDEFANYLQAILDVKVKINPIKLRAALPHYLSRKFEFHVVEFMGHQYLLQVVSSFEDLSPAQLKKQWERVADLNKNIIPILVAPSIDSFNRKRLIEQRIPFVVPNNQLYLPDLGLDLREYFIAERLKPKKLSPSAQLCLIKLLIERKEDFRSLADFAKVLSYSKMSMTRAANELIRHGLVTEEITGKTRWMRLEASPREIWEKAMPLLRNPVQHKKWVVGISSQAQGFLKAGESALSEWSMLSPPSIPVVAVGKKVWKAVKDRADIDVIAVPDNDSIELQVWRYDPQVTSKHGRVDPLSLYLSLNDEADERVVQGLADMIEGLNW